MIIPNVETKESIRVKMKTAQKELELLKEEELQILHKLVLKPMEESNRMKFDENRKKIKILQQNIIQKRKDIHKSNKLYTYAQKAEYDMIKLREKEKWLKKKNDKILTLPIMTLRGFMVTAFCIISMAIALGPTGITILILGISCILIYKITEILLNLRRNKLINAK